MSDPNQLRDRARRCRRLADGLTNRRDCEALVELAAEYEAEAARTEASIERLRALWQVRGPGAPADAR
jgi:hypothetical protein